MIYHLPPPNAPIDQGDIVDRCPTLYDSGYDPDVPGSLKVDYALQRVIVLSQTCDLANLKTSRVVTAVVFDAQALVDDNSLKPADVKGPIRAGRVYGWYFLPRNTELNLPEMIVDLRRLHTVRRELLDTLCLRGFRRARVQPLYREHLAKHFADTYSRIGLPEPYPTD
jgi:hypothetical protein